MSLYIKKINLKKERTSSAIEERNINVENMSMAAFLNENFHHTTSLNFLNPICTKNIRNLTLSNINISCLPIELGRLPFLQSVNLSHNELAQSKWTWLEQDTIKKNLIELDISDNSLTELPPQIGKLNTLTYLKACFNKLRYLPQSIGILQNLKHIYLSHNKLEILPGTLKFLGLMCLDISENLLKRDYFFQNNFDFEIDNALGFKKWKIPTLMELSAKIILGFRIPYNNINLISSTLIKYLDEAKYCCICKKACFDVNAHSDTNINYYLLTTIIDNEGIIQGLLETDHVTLECYFCSNGCLNLFYSDYFRNINDEN